RSGYRLNGLSNISQAAILYRVQCTHSGRLLPVAFVSYRPISISKSRAKSSAITAASASVLSEYKHKFIAG
ncbi:MAG: hypothetical protein WC856_14040, partial [Methylococcaceae bacterium]